MLFFSIAKHHETSSPLWRGIISGISILHCHAKVLYKANSFD